MYKDFDTWNTKKKNLDNLEHFQHPKEKEIWWCSLGLNVGSEVYGKGENFTRPVLVINSEGSETCIVIPLTSNVKSKKYSCIIKTEDGILHSVMVYQIRSIDKRRLTEKIYSLDDSQYAVIKKYFDKLYKI